MGKEWNLVPESYHDLEVKKVDDLKFFACPLSVITPDTWDLIRMVNMYTDDSGRIGNHLPEPEFSLHEQSPRFLAALNLVQRERNSKWFQDLKERWSKQKQ